MPQRTTTHRRWAAMSRRRIVAAAILLATMLIAACSDADAPTGAGGTPMLENVTSAPADSAGPVLIVRASVQRADSARVVVVAARDHARFSTNYVPVVDDSARVVVAGLRAAESYVWQVQLTGPGGGLMGPYHTLVTGPLPSAIRGARIVTTAGVQPTMPYIATELVAGGAKYEVVFDSTGTLVWYRPVVVPTGGTPPGQGDFEMQPTGSFTAYDGTSSGWQPVPGTWLEFGLDGVARRTWTAPSGFYADPHEFRLRIEDGDTAAYFFAYRLMPMDMTGHCGSASQPTAAHGIVRADAAGARIIYDATRRFTVDDYVSPPLCGLGDFDHPNALDFGASGLLIVSWRNLGAITAIDPADGSVRWQLGGRRATLTLAGDPLNGIGGQHSVRVSRPGTILLYDNGTSHVPPFSRMVEYAIDTTAGTATLTREYVDPSAMFTEFMGSVTPLADGGVLIGWSTSATITEIDAHGTRRWEGVLQLDGQAQPFYRAVPLGSLYADRQP